MSNISRRIRMGLDILTTDIDPLTKKKNIRYDELVHKFVAARAEELWEESDKTQASNYYWDEAKRRIATSTANSMLQIPAQIYSSDENVDNKHIAQLNFEKSYVLPPKLLELVL